MAKKTTKKARRSRRTPSARVEFFEHDAERSEPEWHVRFAVYVNRDYPDDGIINPKVALAIENQDRYVEARMTVADLERHIAAANKALALAKERESKGKAAKGRHRR